MPLIVVGISHHTAPLEVRERLAIPTAEYPSRIREMSALPGVLEALVVSTCNRTEVYAVAPPDGVGDIAAWLAGIGGSEAGEMAAYFYTRTGAEAVRHLFRVACGLDSLVLGEAQILGQLKSAWQAAQECGGAGKFTDRLFQRAFATGKTVRRATGIDRHPVSVAYISLVLAQQIFGDLARKTVLMIGAGEMIELCGRHFHQHGVRRLLIANRSLDRARALAAKVEGEALALETLESRLGEADVVVSSTASREPILGPEAVRRALRARRQRPAFLVDLGVPRNIDPQVAELADVYLYTIDDLQQVADENLSQRRQAAEAAVDIIEEAVRDYLRWLHGTRAAEALKRLRRQAEADATHLSERALRQIASGADPATAVRQLSTTLVHKILHGPSARLRQAAENEHYELLQAADWLFDDPQEPDEDAGGAR